MIEIFEYIKASSFFPKYAPDVKDYKKKMSGKNGRGNPIDFSPEDIIQIQAGIKKMSADFKKAK